MKNRSGSWLLAGLILTLLSAGAAVAGKAHGWEKLGERKVSDRVDHDEIAVTSAKGDFKSLKILVRDHAVQFRDMKVHFGNGGTQDVQLRSVIAAGGESRVIDLTGNDRVIRKVSFVYDSQSLAGKPATVLLFGHN
jgi:hypothetical protein